MPVTIYSMELPIRIELESIKGSEGYEYNFIRKDIQKYKCSICNKVCRHPRLTDCCGQNFCWFCLNDWLRTQNELTSCPSGCRIEKFCHIRDVKLKSEIDALRVKCPHWKEGCRCKVGLGSLQAHLECDDGCGYVLVNCPQNCPVRRKDLQSHIRDKCPHRPFECDHCGHKDTYISITFSHYETCLEMFQSCPNKCGVENIKRKDVKDHLSSCPLQLVECPWGCKTKMLRTEIKEHMGQQAEEHLKITQKAFEDIERRRKGVSVCIDSLLKCCDLGQSQRLQLQSIRSILDDSVNLRNEETEITLNATGCDDLEFMYLLGNTRIYNFFTPPFYFMEGYKFRIRIMIHELAQNSKGHRFKKHTIQTSLYLMKGEFDDDVVWPLNDREFSLRIRLCVNNPVNGCESVLHDELTNCDTPSNSPSCSESAESILIPMCSMCCRETLHQVTNDTHDVKIGSVKIDYNSEAAQIAIGKRLVTLSVAVSPCQHKHNIKQRRILKHIKL